jgi:DNA-binding XRE family transcriptional regulator
MTAKLTPEAMRAARALLGRTIQDIAPDLGISPTTIVQVEKGEAVRAATEAKIIEGLDRLGVEITNGGGTGARLRSVPA